MYLLKESLEKIASQQTEEEMLNETFNLNNFLSEPTIKELLTFHVPLHKNILKFLCSYNQILKVFTRCRQIMEALISMRQDSNEIAYSSLIDDQIYPKKEDIDEGYDMYIKENEYVENIEDKLSKNKIKKLENNKNKNFIEKFYKPFMNKRIYKTKLNENISSVKKMTRNSAMENFILEKKKRQIDKISQEILIYNNPSINFSYRNQFKQFE